MNNPHTVHNYQNFAIDNKEFKKIPNEQGAWYC